MCDILRRVIKKVFYNFSSDLSCFWVISKTLRNRAYYMKKAPKVFFISSIVELSGFWFWVTREK